MEQIARPPSCGLLVLLVVAAMAAPFADALGQGTTDGGDTPVDATTPKKRSQSDASIEKTVEYYLKMYGKHLQSRDWIARAMAVISLAQIDDPRTIEKLIEVMKTDKAPIVRVYAWEALHARRDRLTPDHHAEWVDGGMALAKKNVLRGDLRTGLVGVMHVGGPTDENKSLFRRLFANTNSLDPGDIRTLWAMGDLIAKWKSPDLVKALIRAMSNLDCAYRAELILRRITTAVPHSSRLASKGSKVMWAQTQQNWAAWFRQAGLEEIEPGKGGGYKGVSALMPRGEKILDTSDPKWRKDMELGRFRLDQLDVGFAVDSTGSMGKTVRWIQRDVIKMMQAFELISREPRISVVLYRDYGDQYVVRPISLTGDARRLAQALRGADAAGGGDFPEAVYEALMTLLKRQNWSVRPSARKVIVLLGDAPPHERHLKKIEQAVASAVRDGFVFYAIKVRTRYQSVHGTPKYDPALATYDRIAQWGKGKSFWVSFLPESHRASRTLGTASPPRDDLPEQVILREVLKAALADDYADRVDPFINVLMQYVETPVKEKREPFGPVQPHKPQVPHSVPKPVKPPDPQAR